MGASDEGLNDATPQTNNSLLVPIYRIIAKNIKCINLKHIDRHHKRANQLALKHLLKESVRNACNNLIIDCFKEYYNLNEKANLTINYLKETNCLSKPPIDVVNNINKKIIGVRNNVLISSSQKMFKFYNKSLEEEYRCILISGFIDDGKTIKNSFILLETRYSNSYRKKVEKRMKWLCYKYGNTKAVLLSLTIDPKIYYNDKVKMWLDIKNQYHRFITSLQYHFKKQGRVFPRYLCSVESQSNGNPHLHIVFLGASRLLDWRKIRDLWHQGFIYINRTCENQKIRYPINYITKYITKTYCETNEKNLLTQSLSWIFNIRSYSCSRGLVLPLKPKSSGEWIANSIIIVNKTLDLDFIEKNIDIINCYSDPLNPLFKNHWIQ